MKKITTLVVIGANLLIGCVSTKNPTQVTVIFAKHIARLDFDKAQDLLTDSTKFVIDEFRQKYLLGKEEQSNLDNLIDANDSTIVKSLGLDYLQEYKQETKAKVYNSHLEVQLEKNKSEWKIIASPELISEILSLAERKHEINESLSIVRSQYRKKNGFIREMIAIIKANRAGEYNLSRLDTLLFSEVMIDSSFSIDLFDKYINYQNLIDAQYRSLLLELDKTGYSKNENIDKRRLFIEVQNKRIIVTAHEYNKFVEKINRNYIIKLSVEKDPLVEF